LHPNKWLKFVYSGIGYVYTYIDEYNIEIYTTCVPKYPQKAKFRETSRDRELGWNIHGLWLIGCTLNAQETISISRRDQKRSYKPPQ
jgi:hypothetical protein